MSVSIEQIKELRDKTGVSMSACKKALEEANGDMQGAIDVLRKKGEAKAVASGDRSTGQGHIFVKCEGGKGAIVALACETDFVSMSDEFKDLGEEIAAKVWSGEIKAGDDVAELKEAVLRLGENIKLENAALVEGDSVGGYVHSNGRIGVVIALENGNEDLARDVSMHAAATAPAVISPDEVSNDLVEKEKVIWSEQLEAEGKPAEIIEKIMMGKEKKFREENALIKQAFVKNPEQTIEQLLGAESSSVKAFVRYTV